MTIDVTNRAQEIKIMPSTELEEIAQNVRQIISTPKYSVPMDRAFGVDATLLDLPQNVAQAKLSAEIAKAIREQEPRAKLKSARYSGDLDGKLIVTATIEIKKSSPGVVGKSARVLD